jgi:hypothetical protein
MPAMDYSHIPPHTLRAVPSLTLAMAEVVNEAGDVTSRAGRVQHWCHRLLIWWLSILMHFPLSDHAQDGFILVSNPYYFELTTWTTRPRYTGSKFFVSPSPPKLSPSQGF